MEALCCFNKGSKDHSDVVLSKAKSRDRLRFVLTRHVSVHMSRVFSLVSAVEIILYVNYHDYVLSVQLYITYVHDVVLAVQSGQIGIMLF